MREIAEAEARLGRLLMKADIDLPICPEGLAEGDEKARLAVLLAKKIQDLRSQVASG